MTADWTDRIYYGGDLPAEAEKALHMAAAAWHDPALAEQWLAEASRLAPDHRAVKIGHYKYHFYRNAFARAEPWAKACIADSLRALNLPADWRDVAGDDCDFTGLEPEPRFLLYCLRALGYVLVRQGRADEGLAVLAKVVDLDTPDRTATRGLVALVMRGPEEEE